MNIKMKYHSSRTRKGQGLVEFALVMPILLLILMGVIDFGWMLFNYSQLYNGLRDGLRYASVPGFNSASPQYKDCNGIKAEIVNQAGLSGITVGEITVGYDDGNPATPLTACPATRTGGDRVVIYFT